MADHEIVSKLEAAKRQLITAIELFGSERDSLSILALTSAAYELLDKLCAKKDLERGLIFESTKHLSKKDLNKVLSAINNPKNFIKHSNTDPEATLTWYPEMAEHYIWGACVLLRRLDLKNLPREVHIYMVWYRFNYTELWSQGNEIIEQLRKKLGGLTKDKKLFFKVSMSLSSDVFVQLNKQEVF